MPDPIDRRAAERFPASDDTVCTFASPVVEDFGPVKVKNISMDGIGLLISRSVAVGSMLAVCLENKARNFTKIVMVRVAHVTPAHGHFLVGGTLNVSLTYQELTSLIM
jgi:hypothetical protein